MGRRRWSRKRAVDPTVRGGSDETNHKGYADDHPPQHIHAHPDGRFNILRNGTCTPDSCIGTEVACTPYQNGTYTCVCTHDNLPPTTRGECPRNTVKDEVPGRIPIPINIPHMNNMQSTPISTSKNQDTTTEETSASTTLDFTNTSNILIPSILLLISFILGVFLIVCIRKKLRRVDGRASPVNLKRSLLLAERYAPNPQYSACSATGVPLLRKETLSFLKEVGEGCFGKVYKGELLSEEGDQVRIVAIKVLKDTANKEAEEDFLREVEIMSAFRHPNILSLLGVVLKDENVNPMMVFEFMPHGDLAEVLRCQRRTSPEKEVPQLARSDLMSISIQIAKGMRYLASQRFVHRDLACRNCLVAEGPVVKIADFGMSRDVYTCDYYKIGGSRLLPVRWMSPESVVYGRFTLESDIWSYGVILWEIYSYGKQPYYGHSNEEVVKLILDGVMLIPPQDCPTIICELMKNCWKTEPRHRITFSNICDKLELAFENLEPQSEFIYENETKKLRSPDTNRSLPRPPPLPVLTDVDLLDGQGYLKPIEPKKPVTYLETVSD